MPGWSSRRIKADGTLLLERSYLFPTAKDTDGLVLEITPGSSDVTIDFNYAYNASCAYSPLWACPLAPPENFLTVPVRAGELIYKT